MVKKVIEAICSIKILFGSGNWCVAALRTATAA